MLLLWPAPAAAQKRYSQSFQTGQNIRLQLTNKTGTVTVEGWDRPVVSITAFLVTPAAEIRPQIVGDVILIDLVRDNSGRGTGDVNFTIRVPNTAKVDIETKIGNLKVSNVRSGLVRAHITSEGDITLTNIVAATVSAENVTGDIFFDGEIVAGGNYRFASMQGAINLRIPFPSNFKLKATAYSTRSINLGPLTGSNLRYLGDGRQVIGQAGDGSAVIHVTNQRGVITFITR
ncbi:MAG: DUF4097 family beta strand repeat-containing protein [Pyrinomonadaceae bacterium]